MNVDKILEEVDKFTIRKCRESLHRLAESTAQKRAARLAAEEEAMRGKGMEELDLLSCGACCKLLIMNLRERSDAEYWKAGADI